MGDSQKKVQVFDFLNDISFDKQYLFTDDTKTVYNSFLINMGLQQHIDTALLANETNKMGDIPKEWHHDFLFYAIEPKKRYGKWAKADKSQEEQLDLVKQKYQVNREVAMQYLALMTEEDIELLQTKREKGGISK